MFSGIRLGSLRTKIIAWSFVPAAIILSAVALVAFYAYQRSTADLVVAKNRELVRLSAGQVLPAAPCFSRMAAGEPVLLHTPVPGRAGRRAYRRYSGPHRSG